MLYLGFFSISFVFGYLIGASNSPVVGAFLTAIIGLIGVVLGGKYFVEITDKLAVKKYVGLSLLLIASGIIAGEITGEAFRYNWRFSSDKPFPWNGSNPPRSTYEALDWIMVQNRLLDLGYTNDQINVLYSRRQREVEELRLIREQQTEAGLEEYELTEIYNKDAPFYKLLKLDIIEQRKGRGPASE